MRVVHHGANGFDETKWNDIRNENYRNKPVGGLWTSPVDSKMSWFDWCEEADFSTGDNSLSFEIDISGSKILQIDSIDDFDEYKIYTHDEIGQVDNGSIDFEKIAEKYDCLFVTEKALKESIFTFTEINLYGWDCETVVIMNKELILKEL